MALFWDFVDPLAVLSLWVVTTREHICPMVLGNFAQLQNYSYKVVTRQVYGWEFLISLEIYVLVENHCSKVSWRKVIIRGRPLDLQTTLLPARTFYFVIGCGSSFRCYEPNPQLPILPRYPLNFEPNKHLLLEVVFIRYSVTAKRKVTKAGTELSVYHASSPGTGLATLRKKSSFL